MGGGERVEGSSKCGVLEVTSSRNGYVVNINSGQSSQPALQSGFFLNQNEIKEVA